eukprot:gene8394-9875_t
MLEKAWMLVQKGLSVHVVAETICGSALTLAKKALEEMPSRVITLPNDPRELITPLSLINPGYPQDIVKLVIEALTIITVDDGAIGQWQSNLSSVSVLAGVVVATRPVSKVMDMQTPKVLLVSGDVAKPSTKLQLDARFQTAEQVARWKRDEEVELRDWVARLVKEGVNTVVAGGDIDEIALHYMNMNHMLVCSNTPMASMLRLAAAAKVSVAATDITGDLGPSIGTFQHIVQLGLDYTHFVAPNTSTIVLGGDSGYAFQVAKRHGDDMIHELRSLAARPNSIFIDASVDTSVCAHIKSQAQQETTSQRFILESYADSFLILPTTLRENNGGQSTTTLSTQLTQRLSKAKTYDSATHLASLLLQDESMVFDEKRGGKRRLNEASREKSIFVKPRAGTGPHAIVYHVNTTEGRCRATCVDVIHFSPVNGVDVIHLPVKLLTSTSATPQRAQA